MFQLLSKESKIFSVPFYILFLFVVILFFNALDFSRINISSDLLAFAGISLGFFAFHSINLNYQSHLPLFLYTFFAFAFYSQNSDPGVSFTLLTNGIILLLVTEKQEGRSHIILLIGSILAVNFLFFPPSWPTALFVFLHIISTSDRIPLQLFRAILGIVLIFSSYFGIMYFLNFRTTDYSVFPFHFNGFIHDFYPHILLAPVLLMIFFAIANHFAHYNEKSPKSRFKYTFILIFSIAQSIIIFLYMGKNYEYLLLLSLPASIILSRFLLFLPKKWMRESGLWLIIFTLISFKIGTYIKFF